MQSSTKFITLTSFKGGVGKTTSAICLSCLFSEHGRVMLIDSDPNRSATMWASSQNLPFHVATENTATRLMAKNHFDFVVIDTPARPAEAEMQELVEGCDLLLLPTTPDSLSMKAMALTTQSLPKGTNYYVLLTMVPPPPQKDGEDAFKALHEKEYPVIKHGIKLLKVYKDAAALGLPVKSVKGGKKAWRDWIELAKLSPISELLNSVTS
ncbi:ParA family protein [Gloeocapsopsis dulcis]|uniref:ParA family protein n=1 Tax=Gloeocapsopsis dulcis TaxID=2859516 RepID=UPI0012DA2FD2|nr:ParA family protein [Gloeocapsopsis dulcis]WNN92099.1 ParA family protein [Gloeocapsopsis dulcis]